MKLGDKVIFKDGSLRNPIIIKGVVCFGRSEPFVRDEQGTVYSTIGWEVEIIADYQNKEVKGGKADVS